ncbi:hypothetical protein BXZ70DRAFT_1005727 [Cristinia sonorae]|uniref:Uncharacterized protein n=1 Tax=Cristinia sonorae TaxID=1940300 RepID=A0A8K0UTX1_9AGAR|nr:hypothetical protein BXZ70DRAFT_1005727 [Cristinia sonorae]
MPVNTRLPCSPRMVLSDLKNRHLTTPGGQNGTPGEDRHSRRKSFLVVPTIPDHRTSKYLRRHSSALPEDSSHPRRQVDPTPAGRATHARHRSIPKSPVLAFGFMKAPVSNHLVTSSVVPLASSPMASTCCTCDTSIMKNVNQDAITKRNSAPVSVAPIAVSSMDQSLISPGVVATLESKSSCAPATYRTHRATVPNTPSPAVFQQPSTCADTSSYVFRHHTPGRSEADIAPSLTNAGPTSDDILSLSAVIDTERTSQTTPRQNQGASCNTLKLSRHPSVNRDATSLFSSTVSFAAFKTGRLVRDDTWQLPTVSVTSDYPTLLTETPSFMVTRNSPTNTALSPPSYYDLTPSRQGKTKPHYSFKPRAGLCATPANEDIDAVDKALLYAKPTYPLAQGGPIPMSQSRSLSSLMVSLELANPSLRQSLLKELPVVAAESADNPFDVAMAQTSPPPYDIPEESWRDTLMLLDELEMLTVETKALPIPRPPAVPPKDVSVHLPEPTSLPYYDEELCLSPSAIPDDDEFDDARSHHSDSTINTARPSSDSSRTRTPSPPRTPVDPFFAPHVHVISPNETMDTLTDPALPGSPSSKTKNHSATYNHPTHAYPHTTRTSPSRSRPSAASHFSDYPTHPSSSSPTHRLASSPLPSMNAQAILPRSSPILLSNSLDRAPTPPLGPRPPTPGTTLKRLFRSRPSTAPTMHAESFYQPPAQATPVSGGRTKKLSRSEKKYNGWGESFLEF